MLPILKKNSWNYFYLLIVSTFLMIVLKKINSIHLEAADFEVVNRILDPNGPKRGVSYDPHYHFNYIFAFAEKFLFSYTQSLKINSILVWVISEIFVSIVLIKISLFLFKNDIATAFFVFVLYISFKSGEIDQKTVANPLFLLSIYYFLLGKLILCGIFLGIVFYFHVGLGLWLGIPISIATLCLYIKNRNLFNFKEIIYFFLTTLIIISPLLYFYFFEKNIFLLDFEDPFLKEFWYGIHNSTIHLLTTPKPLIQFLIFASMVIAGALTKFNNFKDNKIFALVIGVLGLFVINFILCDVLSSGTAMKLQLLRGELILRILASIFFCYLIVNQVRKNNIFFFLLFCLIVIPNPFLIKYGYWKLLLVSYCILSIYTFFEILKFIPNDLFLLDKKIKFNFITKFYNNILLFLNNSSKLITVLFILLFVQKIISYTSINQELKDMLKSSTAEEELIKEESSLYAEVLNFTNTQLCNKETMLLSPLTEHDFIYFANCRILFGPNSITGYYPENFEIFKNILVNDFKYSIQDIKNINFWERLWHKINEDLLIQWNKTYGLTHIIMEKNIATFDLPVIYEDKFYRIYDLR